MNNDLISREALKQALNYVYYCPYIESKSKEGIVSDIIETINNAPTVEPTYISDMPDAKVKDLQKLAIDYGEGIAIFERKRPQGEFVDISKLRLMTVEECAGHTIGYAMGWKACIEWIKKGAN